MKLTKIVMGCALAAGLMAFATQAAVAATFVGANGTNNLWTPFSVKGKATFQESTNGTFKSHSISSKDLLKDIGFSKDVSFALGPVFGNTNTVWIYNTKSGKGLINLTPGTPGASPSTNATSTISIGGTSMLQNSSVKNGTATKNEVGSWIELKFNSTVGAASGQPIVILDIYGNYDYSSKATSKELSDKLSGTSMTGPLSVSGTGGTVTGNSPADCSLSGSGKLKL